MKAATSAIKYFQKTVSGTKKYVVAPDFHQKMLQLKQSTPSSTSNIEMPSRFALRRHEYYLTLPTLTLPEPLDLAATDCLREYSLFSIKHLSQLSSRLVNYLHDRELLSEEEIIERMKRSCKERTQNDEGNSGKADAGIDFALQYHTETPFVGAERSEREVRRAHLSTWKSLEYTEKNSLLYLVGRLAPNFAVACRILYELRKRCPLFVPYTFFDFASGLGTYTWAVNTVWPAGCIREHHLVEASGPMMGLSEFLLTKRGQGVAPNTTVFPGVRHRRFMPSSAVTGDLVMSGYALLEMAGEHDRRRIVENLWFRTTGFLVFIEEGTKGGHTALLEARDWLIQNGGADMHIFAPCPHKFACSRAGMGCKSSVKYYQFGLTRDATFPSEEAFSYLIVSRGDWRRFTKKGTPMKETEMSTHPRIVSPTPVGGAAAIDVDLCLPDGNCERVIFSKSGTQRTLYFFLRNARAGDIAPCERLCDIETEAKPHEQPDNSES
ncbi:huntingtin interacting protein [Echinococcus multilocularis]|uniref:Huntingtin interacting protein n=1 Tax=Echinococcus multilocularis TaxID=6211 RepID=A0A068Y3X9_ECHMU|nr:huntingtin interacting protein [Echinococcus multilocularis]